MRAASGTGGCAHYHRRVNVGDPRRARGRLARPRLSTATPAVHGAPLPPEPPDSATPAGARDRSAGRTTTRAASGAAELPHVLLGWVGADGFPVVVPVGVDAP